MAKHEYLVLNRFTPGGGGGDKPSPEAMQKMFAAFKEWMKTHEDEIVDFGDKLVPGGRVLSDGGVAEGPWVESKEVVGGYMILTADSYERAVEIMQAMPGGKRPGVSFEIRELSGQTM